MEKDEITYLFSKGFSISDIRKMENPENPVEGGKADGDAEVKEEKNDNLGSELVKPEETDKKKDSLPDYSDVKKELEELKKMIQDKNRKGVELPTPKEKTVEEEMESFFNNL